MVAVILALLSQMPLNITDKRVFFEIFESQSLLLCRIDQFIQTVYEFKEKIAASVSKDEIKEAQIKQEIQNVKIEAFRQPRPYYNSNRDLQSLTSGAQQAAQVYPNIDKKPLKKYKFPQTAPGRSSLQQQNK